MEASPPLASSSVASKMVRVGSEETYSQAARQKKGRGVSKFHKDKEDDRFGVYHEEWDEVVYGH